MVYCILGIKNQTDVHYAMPVRNMLYDSMQYSNQVETARKSHKQAKNYGTHEEFLSGFHKDDYLLPVITLVIYFGADKWDAPRSIRKMMLVRDEHTGLQNQSHCTGRIVRYGTGEVSDGIV